MTTSQEVPGSSLGIRGKTATGKNRGPQKRRSALPLLAFCLLLSALSLCAAADEPPRETLAGYSADAAREERDWETKFRALPSPDAMREYMNRLSARPHHV